MNEQVDQEEEEWLDEPSRDAIGATWLMLHLVCWILGIPLG